MIRIHGIEFPDDETDIAIVDGEPEVMLNRAGLLRLCEHAPDQARADAIREWLKNNPPKS